MKLKRKNRKKTKEYGHKYTKNTSSASVQAWLLIRFNPIPYGLFDVR